MESLSLMVRKFGTEKPFLCSGYGMIAPVGIQPPEHDGFHLKGDLTPPGAG